MDRRKKGEYVGALGALLVHVAVIALLILVSFTVPQPDEDAGGVPVMMGNVDAASGFDDPSLVDVDIMDEDAAAPGIPPGNNNSSASKKSQFSKLISQRTDTSCAPTTISSGVTDTISTLSPARLNVSIAVKASISSKPSAKKAYTVPIMLNIFG